MLGVGGTSVTSAFEDVDRLPSSGHRTPSVEMSLLVSRLQGSLKPFSFLVIFLGDLDAGVRDTWDFRDRSLLAIEVVIYATPKNTSAVCIDNHTPSKPMWSNSLYSLHDKKVMQRCMTW